MARSYETEISRVRVFTLKLTAVSFNEQYIDDDCTILKGGLISSVIRFDFRDCHGNLYTHYQVPPSQAASYSKAAHYLSVISNGTITNLNFLEKDPLEGLRRYCGCYYSCMIRRRKSRGKDGSERIDFDVDDFFYPIPFVDSATFEKTAPRDSYSWEIDLKATRHVQKLKKQREDFLKKKQKEEEEKAKEMFAAMMAKSFSEKKLY